MVAAGEVPSMDEARVAVITGAGSGIGRATALELGRAGYRLALCDLDAVALGRTAAEAGAALAEVADVSRAADVERMAGACRERLGRVDALVNNAGILRLGAWEDLGEADWRKLFEVNLLSVTLVTRAFLPLLAASRGHVVNLGSGASLVPFPGYAAYGPVKVGTLWLSEYLRAELSPLGVRVSCVCPLLVRTSMGEAGQAGVTHQPEWLFHSPEHVARLVRRTVGSRRFLVYGSLLLRVLHLAYRWAPGLVRALLSSVTRGQLRERAQRSA
jgi:NAD(P)-dependent dehydrogenase (short-subunit alcohol dehydrogenase family)